MIRRMARDSMVFYRSFYEAFSELDAEVFKETILSILGYAMDDIEPTVTGTAKAMFLMAKPQIDANNKRYQNGCKGGRSETKHEPKCNQTETKAEPNVNDNDNDNENDNDNDIKKSVRKNFTPPTLEEVKAYILEQGYKVDADRFVDFYTSKNWMVGKNKMKDWKAAVRNWSRQDVSGYQSKAVNSKIHNYSERSYDYASLMREVTT